MAFLIGGSFVLKILAYLRVPYVDDLKPEVVRLFCRLVLKLINIRVQSEGAPKSWSSRGSVIVANHVSYLDAVVLNACFSAKFVTSEEIRVSGLLGWLTSAAGCVFVDRRNKMRLRQDLAMLTSALADGGRVVFFPEGTTGPGLPMLPMKSSLLEAAMRSGATVYVYALSYPEIDGRPTPGNVASDEVAWYGDMEFFPHLWKLLSQKSIFCRLQYSGSVKPFLTGGRKAIAANVVSMIQQKLT